MSFCFRPLASEDALRKAVAEDLMRGLWSMGEEEVNEGETDFTARKGRETSKKCQEERDTVFNMDL